MSKTTLLALLVTVFCGAGSGVFLTFTNNLLGTFLYTAFPFVVGVLFFFIVRDALREAVTLNGKTVSAVKIVKETTQHPKAA